MQNGTNIVHFIHIKQPKKSITKLMQCWNTRKKSEHNQLNDIKS